MVDTILQGDALTVLKTLPDGLVDCVVTSPPYWGLRDYGVPGQLGLEPTLDEYIDKLVAIFREVRRVLKDDGTVWLNMGDGYAAQQGRGMPGAPRKKEHRNRPALSAEKVRHPTKPKDLIGQPWRPAFALQADGWYLRSDIIWAKPNPMPESVTDRPTKAHEYVFLLSKQARYFYDADAVREEHQDKMGTERFVGKCNINKDEYESNHQGWYGVGYKKTHNQYNPAGRNRRTVWTIATQPFPEAHFATFPEALVEPCIRAGTSERGNCAECGKPWVRVVEDAGYRKHRPSAGNDPRSRNEDKQAIGAGQHGWRGNNLLKNPAETIGWKPSCSCSADTVAPIVLDPFMGSGTVALVAKKLNRHFIGIELNPEYIEIANRRLEQVALFVGAV